MTILAILVPQRQRSPAEVGMPRPPIPAAGEWFHAFSRDGLTVESSGSAALQAMPRADRVVLVVHEDDVSWLSTLLPRTPAGRLREVLQGALEDQLLEDVHLSHLAVSRHKPEDGQPTWVAALHRPWIEQQIETVAAAGLHVQALTCLGEPGTDWQAHAHLDAEGRAQALVCGPEGVATCPLDWPGLKARLAADVSWTAQPAAAAALGEVLGVRAPLLETGERLLRAATQGSNLLQFELTPRMKGWQTIAVAWAAFGERRWRAVHVGLAALVLVQLLGLNLAANRERADLLALEGRAEAVLRDTFPSVKVIVDVPVQMERELQALRRASGQADPTELETWLDLVAAFWVGQAGPLKSVRVDASGISLEADPWPPAALEALQGHAARHGWQVRQQGTALQILRPAPER